MNKLMCEPNVSEGRDQDKVDRFRSAIVADPQIKLIDLAMDEDHNRTVFSYLGEPEAVLAATQRLCEAVFSLIDMATHQGSHPRQGSLDVVPFIPLGSMTTDEALPIARAFGRFVGAKGIPVYYYEDAALCPERISLVDVRKGEYEGLAEKLKEPAWAPDEGPAVFVPAVGSVQVAVRFPLVAFNVNLQTADLDVAWQIARAVRFRDGGYRFVRAIALTLRAGEMVQVSMNLTNHLQTPLPRVFETVRSEAARYGVRVVGAELVGPVPVGVLAGVAEHYLQVCDFSPEQIIEMHL